MVFVAVFLIMLVSVFAESGFVQAWGESLTELEGKTLPGALGTLFGNEQINFHIKLDNSNEAVFGMVMENKVVKSVTSSGVAKPTLNVYASEAVIQEIVSSASPPTALLNALKEEKITYKAVGFFNKIKFAFLSVFSNIAALFASEEAEVVEEKVAAGDIAGGTAADSTAAGACATAGACPNAGTCATAGGCSDSGAAGATTDTSACSTTVAGAVGCPTAGACTTAGGCTDTSATTSTDGTTTDTTAGTTTSTDGTTTDTAGNAVDTAGTDTTAATDTTTTAGTLTTGAVADISTGETHIVKMTNEGFSKSSLTINAGDTVVWENVRTGSVLNKAMIIGVRDCRNIKSKFFLPGESFSWTFEEPGECVVVDGIMTTQSSRIIIG